MTKRSALAVLSVVLLSTSAQAHVTLSPAEALAGERTVYAVRMPNERKVNAVRLDLAVPGGAKVSSFRQVPGWVLEVERGADGAIVGAHWTGTLPPDEYAEFAVIARNPDQPGDLVWRARQTYQNGEVVEWSGELGSKTPAPHVTIVSGAAADHSGHH